ncbi:hypothetical protein CAPTEDRAFT_216841 [Capitella teleta]|uniref:G-protein coupled receptors family 1 profile domain-containing protein n=1 Tax=Capitella teleta TaxID=283909 RepID=R7UCS4_CAPTE|nr:hypothetical protein CAPTEDRAFT_216841 [Capitella teleta]|eukprot:ELU03794.1 hypothetical protein CAPTEDRAFT_216841 [Capitella teleta]
MTDATVEFSTNEIYFNTSPFSNIADDLSLWFPRILLTFYLILAVGFILNLITAVALMTSPLLSKGKPVHHLFLNMIISDLIACLANQPFLLFQFTEAGERFILNRKMHCVAAVVGFNIGFDSTVTALLLITCERLFAIISPLQHMHRVTRASCRVAIVVNCLLVTAKSSVLFVWNDWKAACISVMPDRYGLFVYNPNLYLCMGLIVLLNIILAFAVGITQRKAGRMNSSQSMSTQSELKIVKIVFLAVGVLLLTWIPHNALANLLLSYRVGRRAFSFELVVAFHMTRGLPLFGTVADPLIYFLRNSQCQEAVLKLFGRTGTLDKGNKQSAYTVELKTAKCIASEDELLTDTPHITLVCNRDV